MSLRSAIRGLAAVVGGVGLVAVGAAQVPEAPVPRPIVPAGYPAAITPPADGVAKPAAPVVAKVLPSAAPVNAAEAFPKMLADGRAAYSKLRDYACHLVRQERVNGKLHPEQTAELQVRVQPFCVDLKVIAPRTDAGEETVYASNVNTTRVKYRPAGLDGIKYGFQWQSKDDPKTMPDTRHPVTDTGLAAVLDRFEKAVAAEKRMNHPVQMTVAEYVFAGRPCTRYEVFAELSHPHRYAHRCVLFVDKETKLPVRFEAYDQPKANDADGELLEVQSFVGVRTNTGLGDAAFER